jgi:hypothetical protein
MYLMGLRPSCGCLAENVGDLLDEPLMATRFGRLADTRPRRKDVVAARRDVGREFLPGLAELTLDPVADHGVTNRLGNGKAEPGLAEGIVVAGEPMEGQVPGRDRAPLPIDRIEVLRP